MQDNSLMTLPCIKQLEVMVRHHTLKQSEHEDLLNKEGFSTNHNQLSKVRSEPSNVEYICLEKCPANRISIPIIYTWKYKLSSPYR